MGLVVFPYIGILFSSFLIFPPFFPFEAFVRQVNAICLTWSTDRPERERERENRSVSVNVIQNELKIKENKDPLGGMGVRSGKCGLMKSTEITFD